MKKFNTMQKKIALLLTSLLLFISFSSFSDQPVNKKSDISIDILELEKKQIDANTSFDVSLKSQILEYYNQAILSFHASNKIRENLNQLKLIIQRAPARIKEIRAQANQVPPKSQFTHWEKLTIEAIEQQLKLQELQLQQNKLALKQKEEELSLLIIDNQKHNENITQNNRVLQDINQDLLSTKEDNSTLQKAHLMALNIRKTLRETEIQLAQLRYTQQDLLTTLVQSERNTLIENISHQQRELDLLLKFTQQKREINALDARKKAEQNQQQSQQLPPELQTLSDEIRLYRVELENLLKKEVQLRGKLNSAHRDLEFIKSSFERIQQRVNILGATAAVNKLLRNSQKTLPSTFSFRESTKQYRQTIGQATERQLIIDDTQRELADNQLQIEKLLEKILLTNNLGPKDLQTIKGQVAQHLQLKREALNELQKIYSRYISQLSALVQSEQERIEIATQFSSYIESQLLWIPNTHWKQLFEVSSILPGLAWYGSDEIIKQSFAFIERLEIKQYLTLFLGICLSLIIFKSYKQLIEQLNRISVLTRKIRTDSFSLSLKALLLTIIISLPWSILLICAGWSIQQVDSNGYFLNILSETLIYIGLIFLTLNLIRQVCRDNGLGIYHLRWTKEVCTSLKTESTKLLIAILPLAVLINFGNKIETPAEVQLLGNYAYLIALFLGTLFTYKILHKKSALMLVILNKNPDNWIVRLHFIWFPLTMMIALVLISSVVMGYQYTVWQLQQQIQITFWFLLFLWIAKDLLLRWLYITERRFRFEEAVRYREEQQAQRMNEPTIEETSAENEPEEVPDINYSELSEQARRLLYVGFLFGVIIGLWLIWREWLPSINLFFQTPLSIYTSETIDGITKSVPITLADLITAFLTLFITILAGKNLPGVLEITLLQHLPIEAGARYAISTLSQYVIVGIGLMVTFTHMGFEWSKIQWLVAALSVGLGFGLQEIVANFISGIILLFERPIRVGDYVTVGESSGTINKINIRATTITNFDRQELLIPNKEFITGRVLNWTLSNKLNRIIIDVGIAYDSDLEKALLLIKEAACEAEFVLDDPEPSISFDRFGDSALLLSARCYLLDMENRLDSKTEMNTLVLNKFKQAGIEIAFPQQDIHIKTKQPISMKIINEKNNDN